ncbi:hypothetical protein Ahy_B10g104723 isoform A [Arachis hypogaea]|uniref:Uncharacterized protein n=1 Tax=Arachis hypogaea TaxID=3818 RepID=A0A444X6C1_ARAHY|nr:hypothetical protein Ahy_B10g104723 isoform A [Arachis hypogaea]
MERVESKIECWKESILNQAGKEVLIKAVLQAIPSYAMSILRFPKTFCNKLCAKIARFWRRNKKRDKDIHWRAWPKLWRVFCETRYHLVKKEEEANSNSRPSSSSNLENVWSGVWNMRSGLELKFNTTNSNPNTTLTYVKLLEVDINKSQEPNTYTAKEKRRAEKVPIT